MLLDAIKKYTHKHFLLIVLLILGAILPADMVHSHFLQKTGVQKSGIPSILWIAMGTDIDNTMRGAGWYDFSVNNIYIEADNDPDLAYDIGIKKLENNWQKIKQHPQKANVIKLN